MFNFFKRKLERSKQRSTFQKYGFKLKTFQLSQEGEVGYAQWLHPFESEKEIKQEEVNFIRNYIKEGDFVIDIGAHTGDSTIPLALAAGKTGCVLGLEPNKYVFKILEKNAALNQDKTHIVPLNFAATEADGKLIFNYSDASFCNGGYLSRLKKIRNHNYPLEVNGKNLNNYLYKNYSNLLPKFSFIKVDAEGYDKEILKSLHNLLNTYHPVILSECYRELSKDARFDFYNFLTQNNYRIHILNDLFSDKMELVDAPSKMLTRKHFDFLAIPLKQNE